MINKTLKKNPVVFNCLSVKDSPLTEQLEYNVFRYTCQTGRAAAMNVQIIVGEG
jgi:hypothetical protein